MPWAVVLGAGTSTRLGRPKQLLELDGRPLLQHMVDVVSPSFDGVVIVLGHEAERIEAALTFPANARVVVNERYPTGQASSVLAGVAAVDEAADRVAVFVGDQPRMPRQLIDEVLAASAAADVVRPGSPDAPGHPVVVRGQALERLRNSDEDPRPLLRGSSVHYVETSLPQPADVDTWEAYEALRRQ
jgi:molybdenum cofactor cytidylyltransferase